MVPDSTRLKGFGSVVSPKSRSPVPRTIGKTISRTWSTRSCSISVPTS